jgi:hypothetical protein
MGHRFKLVQNYYETKNYTTLLLELEPLLDFYIRFRSSGSPMVNDLKVHGSIPRRINQRGTTPDFSEQN